MIVKDDLHGVNAARVEYHSIESGIALRRLP